MKLTFDPHNPFSYRFADEDLTRKVDQYTVHNFSFYGNPNHLLEDVERMIVKTLADARYAVARINQLKGVGGQEPDAGYMMTVMNLGLAMANLEDAYYKIRQVMPNGKKEETEVPFDDRGQGAMGGFPV